MRFLILAWLFLGASIVHAFDEPSSIKLLENATQHLKPIDNETYEHLLAQDSLMKGMLGDQENVLRVDIPTIDHMLDAMMQQKWGVVELFGHPFFAQSEIIIYLSPEVTRFTTQKYAVGGFFFSDGKTRKDINL